MGMFDYLIVEVPLPDGTPAQTQDTNEPYQTKSLESYMETYHISPKGELYRDKWDYQHTEDPSSFLANEGSSG